jgi:hypothetical protein
MNRERPVIVLVFAILNIVFGTLGALCSFCSGIMSGFAFGIMNAVSTAGPMTPVPHTVLVIGIIEYAIGFILCGGLAVSGIGLLTMKSWARKIAVVVAVLGIVVMIIVTTISITYVNPTIREWQSEIFDQLQRQQPRQAFQPNFAQFQQSPALSTAISVFTALLIIAYGVALIVVMFLPQVTAAFAGGPFRRRIEWDRETDDEGRDESDG